jgi:hypothetical protein
MLRILSATLCVVMVVFVMEMVQYIQRRPATPVAIPLYYQARLTHTLAKLLALDASLDHRMFCVWDTAYTFCVLPTTLDIPHITGTICCAINDVHRTETFTIRTMYLFRGPPHPRTIVRIPAYAHTWCIVALSKHLTVRALHDKQTIRGGTVVTSTHRHDLYITGGMFLFITFYHASCGL